MSYQPQPGTIAFRAIAWLEKQPKGTEVLVSVWAEAIDVAIESLLPCLRPALEAGVVHKRTKDGHQRPAWFSLGDGTPLRAHAHDEEPELLPHRNVAPEVKPRPGEMLPGVRGNEPVAADADRMTAGEVAALEVIAGAMRRKRDAQPEPRPFDAWFSGCTGEIVLQGVTVDPEGDVVLSKQQVRAVLAALSGVAV